MKGKTLALATAVTIGMSALTAKSPAEARWRGGGWGGGWGPGLAAGLVGAAVIGYYGGNAPGYYYGGYASRPYGYGGYGYRSPADDDGFGSGGYYSRW